MTGISRKTLRKGIREVGTLAGESLGTETGKASLPISAGLLPGRLRRPGGGRKPLTQQDPTVLADLEAWVDPLTRGDPQSPLRWTCKSTTKLAEELRTKGHRIHSRKVASLLHELGYSLQSNRKTREGSSHPDRNGQFEYINGRTQAFQKRGQPGVSVDAKKKELVGTFKNGGHEGCPEGCPQEVEVYDFLKEELGKGLPYGVYDLTRNEGGVSVGIDPNTAEFARQTLETGWDRMGKAAYPKATELGVIADGGGSNSSRSRRWKVEIQALANRMGLSISVCHFPPGMSKWNKIEHRMFCHITQNWRGRPLESLEVIVELIGHTTPRQGLRIQAELDRQVYPTGREVTDDELAQVKIKKASFHGEWNYTISPTL